MPVQTRPSGRLVLIAGASGSGKTLLAQREGRRHARLLVWDVEAQWASALKLKLSTHRAGLVRLAQHGNVTGVAYQAAPSAAEFDFFCRVAWYWLQAGPGMVVVEELADVTTPAKAPPAWGKLVRRGRKYGGSIVAITQRPAESDKTIVGNASDLYCLRMSRANDREYMARELDVPAERVAALKPLDYLHRDQLSGLVTPGRVQLPRGPRPSPVSTIRSRTKRQGRERAAGL